MADGSGTIQIVSDTHQIRSTIPMKHRGMNIDSGDCEYWTKRCEWILDVLKHAGVSAEPDLTLEDIYRSAADIMSVYLLLHPELVKGPGEFSTVYHESMPTPFQGQIIFANYVRLSTLTVGYTGVGAVAAKRVDDLIKWTTDRITLLEVAQLHGLPRDFNELIATAKQRTGCQYVCAREFSPVSEDQPLTVKAE